MKCSTKGCRELAVFRYISPEGTEFPVCIRDFWQHHRIEVISEMKAMREKALSDL